MRRKRVRTHKQQCLQNAPATMWSQWSSQDAENTNLLLQERSLDGFCQTIKEQDKAGNQSVRIQSAFCEGAYEQNRRGLKITVVKVVNIKNYNEQVVIVL